MQCQLQFWHTRIVVGFVRLKRGQNSAFTQTFTYTLRIRPENHANILFLHEQCAAISTDIAMHICQKHHNDT